jgi:hypothetical protein
VKAFEKIRFRSMYAPRQAGAGGANIDCTRPGKQASLFAQGRSQL